MDKELEEAAERFYPPTTTDLICSPKLVRDSFIAGGNHMAERMYSEEDMKQFGLYLGDNLKKLKGKSIDEIFEQFKKK
jgi:hypothetical protein